MVASDRGPRFTGLPRAHPLPCRRIPLTLMFNEDPRVRYDLNVSRGASDRGDRPLLSPVVVEANLSISDVDARERRRLRPGGDICMEPDHTGEILWRPPYSWRRSCSINLFKATVFGDHKRAVFNEGSGVSSCDSDVESAMVLWREREVVAKSSIGRLSLG